MKLYFRFLQGDYCLEVDLDKGLSAKSSKQTRLSIPSEIFDALFERTPSTESEDSNAFYDI